MTDFIVGSQGLCFLCLNKITTELECNQSSQIYSLHSLSRYLKLDMGIVFHESKDNVPDQLIAKVRKSKLKAELCQGCADLNQRLSVLHHQLEKIEMEVISNLNFLHQRIAEAGETDLNQKLASFCESGDSLAEKVKIADLLRTETIQKCSKKLDAVGPKVKVQKMTAGEIKLAEKRTRSRFKRNSHREYSQESDLKVGNIKIETLIPETEGFDGHDDDDSFQPIYFTVEGDDQVALDQRRPAGRISRKKFKKPNRTAPAKKKRFGCRECKMQFTSKFNYERHALSIHMGKRYPCRYCSRVFTQSGHWSLHMRKTCPKRKMFKIEVNT